MKTEEYGIMFSVEDRHWWYVALRAMLARQWRQYLPKDAARVLDAGCGTGATLDWIVCQGKEGGRKVSYAGIDASPVAVAFCRQRGHDRTTTASLEDLPFPDNMFDAVLSCDVLCNRGVRDKRRALDEVQRVLKPGGTFIINLPAYQWLYSSHDAAVLTDRRFTQGEVEALLRTSGFEILYSTYWNTLLFPAMMLVRLLRKGDSERASDLDAGVDGLSNWLFGSILTAERALLGIVPLPFGLSILAVARKR